MPFDIVLALSLIGYWLILGGDNMGGRFLLVLFPLGILRSGRIIESRWTRRWQSAGVIALLALFQLHPMLTDRRFHYRNESYDCWIELGRYLGEHHPGTTLAIDAAGKVPYFSGLTTLDMLGLNDSHIARLAPSRFVIGHSKYDPDYVLAQRPDWIATWSAWPPSGLDLGLGLNEDRYRAAGYELRYVVNRSSDRKPAGDILDVRGSTRGEILELVAGDYRYLVLGRARAE